MRIEAVIFPEKEGGFSVSIPAFDIWTQGETREECYAMAKDALVSILETEIEGSAYEARVHVHPEAGDTFTMTVPEQEALQLMLKQLRASHGLSLADVSKAMGSNSKNSFAQYEQGAREPGISKLSKLLEVLQYDLVLSVRNKKAV